VEIFVHRGLPILTAFPSVDVEGGRLKRTVLYQSMPDSLSTPEILRIYASRLEDFIRAKPEQLLTLIGLGGLLA